LLIKVAMICAGFTDCFYGRHCDASTELYQADVAFDR